MYRLPLFLAVILVMNAAPANLCADVILPNLPPGSKYQLAFVSVGTIEAVSTNIVDYNQFVSQQASLNSSLPQGLTWTAIASTSSENAIDNAPTYANIPIYNTNGQMIFASGSAMWGDYLSFDNYLPPQSRMTSTGAFAPAGCGPAPESTVRSPCFPGHLPAWVYGH